MTVGYTFTVEKECPVCSKKFQATKTRTRLIKISQDTDFCVHYKDFNPYYYTVWICSHCGYAAEEKYFDQLKESDKKKIADFLSNKKVSIQYKETRTREEAVAAYKLAIYFAEMTAAPASRMAGLYLKLGWLYREGGDKELELGVLQRALDCYDRSLVSERYPVGAMSDITVTYLIGDLYRRLGDMDKATQYLSQVIGDRRAKSEPTVYNLARDLWQEIRTMKEEG